MALVLVVIRCTPKGPFGQHSSVLRKAISKRESVGESYLGFMSDVKEELEVRRGCDHFRSSPGEMEALHCVRYGRDYLLDQMLPVHQPSHRTERLAT